MLTLNRSTPTGAVTDDMQGFGSTRYQRRLVMPVCRAVLTLTGSSSGRTTLTWTPMPMGCRNCPSVEFRMGAQCMLCKRQLCSRPTSITERGVPATSPAVAAALVGAGPNETPHAISQPSDTSTFDPARVSSPLTRGPLHGGLSATVVTVDVVVRPERVRHRCVFARACVPRRCALAPGMTSEGNTPRGSHDLNTTSAGLAYAPGRSQQQ